MSLAGNAEVAGSIADDSGHLSLEAKENSPECDLRYIYAKTLKYFKISEVLLIFLYIINEIFPNRKFNGLQLSQSEKLIQK